MNEFVISVCAWNVYEWVSVYVFVCYSHFYFVACFVFFFYYRPHFIQQSEEMRQNMAIRSLHTNVSSLFQCSMNGRVRKIMAAINEHMRKMAWIQEQMLFNVVGTTYYYSLNEFVQFVVGWISIDSKNVLTFYQLFFFSNFWRQMSMIVLQIVSKKKFIFHSQYYWRCYWRETKNHFNW